MRAASTIEELISRRDFFLLTAALIASQLSQKGDETFELLAACESVLKTASARILDDLWDEHGRETPLDSGDTTDLQNVFELFLKNATSMSEFLFTKKFVSKPTSSNGIDFVLPYADQTGVGLDVMLRQRIMAQPTPLLLTRAGRWRKDYVQPTPKIEFPAPAAALKITLNFSASENSTASTFPVEIADNIGTIRITLTAGFVRHVMQSCIYANPVIRDSRTLLWQTLKLNRGPDDSILVESGTGPASISLLPLMCAVERDVYKFKTDSKQITTAMESFHRVFRAFTILRAGDKLPRDVDVRELRKDITSLTGIFEIFFLTFTFILSHEVAHAVYLHTVTTDQKRNHQQELIADQAATLHLLMFALTNLLNTAHTWTKYWKYSLIGTDVLRQQLLWFERLFGFGVATNIALEVLERHANATHPENEERWERNVRVWNNSVLAFSVVTTPKT
jgi:hypothetical protein